MFKTFEKLVHGKYVVLPIALLVIILDQLTKFIVRTYLPLHDSIVIIPGVFNFTHTQNTGAAFSLFTGQVEILTVISFAAMILIICYFIFNKNPFTTIEIIAWSLLLGGTCGNLIDRLFLKSVTDFLDFALINFPVFNIADTFIDIGALMIIVISFMNLRDERKESQQNQS